MDGNSTDFIANVAYFDNFEFVVSKLKEKIYNSDRRKEFIPPLDK